MTLHTRSLDDNDHQTASARTSSSVSARPSLLLQGELLAAPQFFTIRTTKTNMCFQVHIN